MTEPAKFNPRETPFVILAGKNWPIPVLGPRQMRHIFRQIMSLTDALNVMVGENFGEKAVNLSNEQYNQVCEVVYHGLSKAHPDLLFDEFLDMEVGPIEMLMAFLVVRAQTQLFNAIASSDAAPEGGTKGEAKGPNRTGTASSRAPAATSTGRRTTGKTR